VPETRTVPETRAVPETRVEPPGRRWMWGLAAVLALGAMAGGAVLLWPRDRAATTAGVVVVDAAAAPRLALADATPPTDAAALTPDASVAPAAPPDARPHTAHRPTPPRPDAGASLAPGTLQLSSTPWATVRIVGRHESCKETPCTLRLPAGTYRVRFENPLAHLDKETVVKVESGRTITVRESLTRP